METLELDERVIGLPEEKPSVEDIVMSEELYHILHGLLDDMPDSYRLLLTLRHMQELSYTEIAEVTGMPLGTVKTGIYRARQQIRQQLINFEATYG